MKCFFFFCSHRIWSVMFLWRMTTARNGSSLFMTLTTAAESQKRFVSVWTCDLSSRTTLEKLFRLSSQDMSSLMHTIYDVVDASVNQSCHNKSKTLRVKLTVTPEPRCHRRETGTGKSPSKSPALGQQTMCFNALFKTYFSPKSLMFS